MIVKYTWTFGDGTVSYEANPVHIYTMPGVYSISLTTIDDTGLESYVFYEDYIHVYNVDYNGGANANKTDICLRFAIPQQPQQGVGWSIYDDLYKGQRTYDWPFPVGAIGICQIIDDNDVLRVLAVDCNTFEHYELGSLDQWVDGEDDYSGSDIESEILFREHTAPIGASAKIKHSQSHLDIKPWFKDYRGAEGYTADGFKTTFEADLYARVDSTDQDAAITKQVPLHGQLIFDRHLLTEYLQEGVIIRGAPWRLVSVQQWFFQQDTAAAPPKKLMTEKTWANELSEPVTWFPRSVNLSMDYATAVEANGSESGTTTGPDGKGRSAVVFGAGDQYSVPTIDDLAGDFTALCWLRNPTSGITLLQMSTGNLAITLTQIGANWTINWNDGLNNRTILLDTNFSSWTLLTFMRSGRDLVVYVNYALADTVHLESDDIIYGGQLTFGQSMTWFDFRLLEKALSAEAIEYVYKDVTENDGNAVCPVF